MRLAALVSGGKDSVFSAYLCETHGWSVEELLTLFPSESDSMLFHTPNLSCVPLLAKAWGKRFVRGEVHGTGEPAELQALVEAFSGVAERGLDGVVVGAIQSTYQWSRVWQAAHQTGTQIFAPLWRASQPEVLREMISAGIDARIVSVASEPLTEELLDRRIDEALLEHLTQLSSSVREFNVSGEGGEYESLVVDAPFLDSRIEFVRSHIYRSGTQATLMVEEAELVPQGGRPRNLLPGR